MIKNLVMLLIVALIGWIVYVTFFGKPEDIELRNKLLGTGKQFGQSVVDIFKSESGKVKDGTYDEVFKKLDGAIEQLKQADQKKGEYSNDIKRLTDEKQRLEKLIEQNKGVAGRGVDPNAENNENLKKLAQDIVDLTNKMETK